MEEKRLPSKERVLSWAGWLIMGCSVVSVVVLLVMKFILKEEAYLSDILIMTGFAFIGYAMAAGFKRTLNQKIQEENKNEQH